MGKYSMGIDFGTLSARAVIVDINTKEEIMASVSEYKHAVISETFINGEKLPPDSALQHPQDYLDSLYFVIKDSIEKSGVNPCDIIGVGVDFTASTILPVTLDGTPLCFLDEYRENPNAYVKLWKDHTAQKEADRINALAKELSSDWIKRYGGTISCEWLFPKILYILNNDEKLYNDTQRFIEAGDWIVWKLTGKESHSVCTTGFKAMWSEENGYPDKEFLEKLDDRLCDIAGTKLSCDISKLSKKAGSITEEIEALTGLKAGTPVMPAFIDAHAALPALGITNPGELLMIIGTSSCHILLGDKPISVPGISGYVKDGIVDGLYAFEAGQSCVGDSFDWFIKNCVPQKYFDEAKDRGVNIHKLLREKAKKLSPGSNGLIALDWWNGNRTPYVNGNLTGVVVGMDIHTLPEEIYRALIEATAYGTRTIIEIYEQNGIKIEKLYATGGIAEKDELLMQIYADVTGREIYLSGTNQGCAYGSAVLGAVNERGYKDLKEASQNMKKIKELSYKPNMENKEKYDSLFESYKKISKFFAENGMMEELKKIK
ncbi:MAG: ribulokinase [Clostridia bacterium]|nr:ribulokinase [Clostridia bacterium]